jgi:peptidoglycan/xylan/chitin deacetylase (PgdA/CDA1 family)
LERLVPLPATALRDRMLSWEQIRTMDRAGISFGSHTMSHPVVSRLTPLEMETELLESKRILEQKLGHPVQNFAFPFGKREECGGAAREILTRGGYRSAVTTEWGLNTPHTDPLQLNRVSIGEERSLAMFAFQLNRLFLRATVENKGAGSTVSSEARQAPEEARSAAR